MTTKRRARPIQKADFVPARVRVAITPGEMLKTLRELQGLTQEKLAKRAKISQSNLSALETGARMMGRERALALGRALKVHPAVLLFPDFDMSEVA